jgi:hypothetical protein
VWKPDIRTGFLHELSDGSGNAGICGAKILIGEFGRTTSIIGSVTQNSGARQAYLWMLLALVTIRPGRENHGQKQFRRHVDIWSSRHSRQSGGR